MVNVDAATFEDPPRMGIGIVIRDHSGSFVAACCHKIDRITDAEMAEALVVRYAVYFAKEHNLRQVLVASDCLNLIKKIQSPVMDRSHVGVIVQEIKYVASGSSISFIHISRWCNQELM